MKKLFNLLLSAFMLFGFVTPIYAEGERVLDASTEAELVQAIKEAKNGDTIQLTKNIELENTLNISGFKDITLDINGKSLTLKQDANAYLIHLAKTISSLELVLTDSSGGKGRIESSENTTQIYVGSSGKLVTRDINIIFNDKNHTASNVAIEVLGGLTVEKGTYIQSSEGGILGHGKRSKLNIKDGIIDAEYYAISGNGSKNLNNNTAITINGGTLKANNGPAIYHPQKGTLTLNGGTITGLAGVQMCSGTLNIPAESKVEVTATGEDEREGMKFNGPINDGRPISLVKRDYDGGDPVAIIAGGSFVSEHTDETILAYAWLQNSDSEWNEASENTTVSGGEFNKRFNKDFVKEGSSFLVVDDTYYVANDETLPSIVAQANKTIEIIKTDASINNVPDGVIVTNSTEKDVIVNGTPLVAGKEVTITTPTPPIGGSGGSTAKLNPVYRAYNPNNGEHLYTLDEKEYKYVTSIGWDAEGVAFMAEEEKNGQALYRVYNPNSGLHHYTLDENEKNTLVSLGWHDEKVAWYTSKKPQSAPVYRVYNPNDGNHHYTMNQQEKDVLVSLGWQFEGIAFRTAPIETN